MSLRRRERVVLARTEQAIGQADARLAGMFAVFNALAAGEGMPAAERVRRHAGIRARAQERAFALMLAALVAMLAGSAVLTPGPACGRGLAGTAAAAPGCLIPDADRGLLRGSRGRAGYHQRSAPASPAADGDGPPRTARERAQLPVVPVSCHVCRARHRGPSAPPGASAA